jgi:hypothetical protein
MPFNPSYSFSPRTFFLNAMLVALSAPLSAQTTHMNGEIRHLQLNTPVANAVVRAKNVSNGNVYGSTQTNAQGLYDFTFMVSSVPPNELPQGYSLSNNYPQPFNPSTKLIFETPTHAEYEAAVYDVNGREVVRKKLSLGDGTHVIDVSGIRAAGAYFFRLEGKDFNVVRKLLNLGGYGTPDINASSAAPQERKQNASKTSVADSIDVEVAKDGYLTNVKRIAWAPAIAHNDTLSKIAKVTSLNMKPILMGYLTPLDVSLAVKTDAERIFHTENGNIRVFFEDFSEEPIDSAHIYVVASDSILNPYITIRRKAQHFSQTNIAENTTPQPWDYATPPDTLKTSLEMLASHPDTLMLWLEPLYMPHPYLHLVPPFPTDAKISTMSDTVRSIFHKEIRPNKRGMGRWFPQPGAPGVEIFQLGWHIDTGQIIGQADSARVKRELDKILAHSTLPTGDVLFEWTYHYPLSPSDSVWQAAVARGTNLAYTRFANTPTPSNFVDYFAPNTSIMKFSSSRYSLGHGNNAIHEEVLAGC